jgi:hypothetical protein
MNGASIQCGDLRTGATFKLEAFDLADDGSCLSFFRRTMVILKKVLSKPGIPVDKILSFYTNKEIERHPEVLTKSQYTTSNK